jgi:4-hydroxy-tetrahydrodipicolinate reductase
MDQIRVAVAGALGKMGLEVVKTVIADPGMTLVAAIDREGEGRTLNEFNPSHPEMAVHKSLGTALDQVQADVLVDFTHHSSAGSHAVSAIKRGVSPVIGTTGLRGDELKEISIESKEQGVPGIYAPNFAIGAVLMMRFSQLAAQWLPDVEIIELHHDQKVDAPSGTAMLTAELIAEARKGSPSRKPTTIFKADGARGATVKQIPVHSVRLRGFVAHQEVIFGGVGEVLTLRHDSLDRSSFMEGVKICVREVRGLSGFTVGLDKILFR